MRRRRETVGAAALDQHLPAEMGREMIRDKIRDNTINVAASLRGADVISAETAERLGIVADAIADPARGVLIGLVLRARSGEARNLATERLLIGPDAVLAGGEPEAGGEGDGEGAGNGRMEDGVYVCGELIGASVVTEEGELLGRISEVYLVRDEARLLYRVVDSPWSRLFRGGFFICGDAARAWSRLGLRLIVPAETTRSLAVSSLERAASSRMRRDR